MLRSLSQREDKEQISPNFSRLARLATSNEPHSQSQILADLTRLAELATQQFAETHDNPLSDLVDMQSVRKSKFTVKWEIGGVVETYSFKLAMGKLYAVSMCLGQESRTKIWDPIVQLSVGLRVWHKSNSYGVVELTKKVGPEPHPEQQQQRTMSRRARGIKKAMRLHDAVDASITLLRKQSTLYTSQSDYDLKRLAQESARAEGFVAGVECTAQELKAWAKTRAASAVGSTITTGSAVIDAGAAMGSAVIDTGAVVGSAVIDTSAAVGKATVDALAQAIFKATETEQVEEEDDDDDDDDDGDVDSLPLDGAPRSGLDLKVHA